MKSSIFCILLLTIISIVTKAQNICPVIPQPAKAVRAKETFHLNRYTSIIVADKELLPVAHYLQQQLLAQYAIPLSIQTKPTGPVIRLSLTKTGESEEAYQLAMNAKQIHVTSAADKGVFYGVISLLQLVSGSLPSGNDMLIDCWTIEDTPLYEWRGLMLDESRHFFGIEKVKSILNWMAFYKLNRFHWHLTDEPAWRIEIKKYPRLALIGGIGSYTNANAPAQFYTQQQIAEVISYAAERNIVVIPEIDMPGHATAANRAYPEFSGGGSEKHPDFTFHPGKDATYDYLTNILQEVNALFPSKMLHLGGDEVSFGNDKWMTDKEVQALMQKQGLINVAGIERYFMKRMADSVFKMDAQLLAWDEVVHMDLPEEKTIVFWWRHDKPEQLQATLKKGYKTVLCPRLPFYFDFVQDSTHELGRKWDRAYNPLENVYHFNTTRLNGITAGNQGQVLGIQANVWTETITDNHRLDFMLYPRIAALAETAWTPDRKKNYRNFTGILKQQYKLYNSDKINFYTPFKD